MLASQLCVFDHKADSKSKWVKKLIVWLILWRFLPMVLCSNLMTTQAKWRRYHTLTQGIRTIKTFTEYKSTTADHFDTRTYVECWDHCDKVKIIKINQRYPVWTTHILPNFSIFLLWNWNCWENQVIFWFWVWLTSHWC